MKCKVKEGFQFPISSQFVVPASCVGCGGQAAGKMRVGISMSTQNLLATNYHVHSQFEVRICASCARETRVELSAVAGEAQKPASESNVWVFGSGASIMAFMESANIDGQKLRASNPKGSIHAANPDWARSFAQANDLELLFHRQSITLYSFGKHPKPPSAESKTKFADDAVGQAEFFVKYTESASWTQRRVFARLKELSLLSIFAGDEFKHFQGRAAKKSRRSLIVALAAIPIPAYTVMSFISIIRQGKLDEPAENGLFGVICLILTFPCLIAVGGGLWLWLRYRAVADTDPLA